MHFEIQMQEKLETGGGALFGKRCAPIGVPSSYRVVVYVSIKKKHCPPILFMVLLCVGVLLSGGIYQGIKKNSSAEGGKQQERKDKTSHQCVILINEISGSSRIRVVQRRKREREREREGYV